MTTAESTTNDQSVVASAPALDELPAPLREPIRRYAAVAREALGGSVIALTVFGDALSNAAGESRREVESVLVLQSVELPLLRKLAARGPQLGKDGITAPLVMAPRYISASLDAFPLELIEIQQRHVTVFGRDHFQELAFDAGCVRLQCERELKRVLVGLLEALLASTGKEKAVALIEADARRVLLRTLRGLLWLGGEKAYLPPTDVAGRVEAKLERKFSGLRSAIAEPSRLHWRDFDELYRDVESLGEIANAW